jgi:twinkle protein
MRRGTIDYSAFVRFDEELRAAESVGGIELVSVESRLEEIRLLYQDGFKPGLSTGWPAVDGYYTLRHGEVNVVTGIPGHGKSSWVDNLIVNSASLHDWRWVIFSPENFPIARHVATLTEIHSGLPFNRGPRERISPEQLAESLAFLHDHLRFIEPSPDGYRLNRLIELASYTPDIDAFLIDPWNELDNSRPRDQREDEYISGSLTKLRWLARNCGIAVFIVVHPGKYQRRNGDPKPVISLNDCKGASEWYAKADNGLSVWREELEPAKATQIHVQKIRFRDVGRVGMADLYYDRVNGRFNDPTKGKWK